jgi:apolipoprotein N-acyltransferase
VDERVPPAALDVGMQPVRQFCVTNLDHWLPSSGLGCLETKCDHVIALKSRDPGETMSGYARGMQRNPGMASHRSVLATAGRPHPGPGEPARTLPGRLRLRWALLAATVGGLALAGAFPPVGIWPLAAAGPALLVVALYQQRLRTAFGLGLVFGLAFFVPLISWLVNVAWYAWIALAVAEALIFGVLAVGQRLMFRLPGWPVAVAAWWVAAEAMRGRWPYAFPWGRLAMSQASSPAAHWAAIGGPPLLTFLVALVGATVAWVVLRSRPRPATEPARTEPASNEAEDTGPQAPARWRRPAASALVLTAVIALALAAPLLPVDQPGPGSSSAVVAAIQGNVPHARNLPDLLRSSTVTQNHAAATKALAAQVAAGSRPAPDVVIWPENSTDLDPAEYPAIYATIASAVSAVHRPVLVGALLAQSLRNAGQLWLPGRGPVATYIKRQLVPFGEYIPFRGLLSHITSLTSLQPVNFTAGDRPVVFRLGKVRLGDVICYEIGFDGLVRSEVAAGANLLALQSNDATFEVDGQSGESTQQVAMARIQAVTSNRGVVYASTTGESAIIAPNGTVLAHSGLWQRAELEARVPLHTSTSLANRLGGWPEAVLTALAIAALAWVIAGEVSQARRTSRQPSQ